MHHARPKSTLSSRLQGGCLLAVVALSGCASLDQMAAENYRRQCDQLGIARGTPTYDQCMLQQQALEEQGVQRSMDRAAMRKHSY